MSAVCVCGERERVRESCMGCAQYEVRHVWAVGRENEMRRDKKRKRTRLRNLSKQTNT
jgi:hypothetical protein